MPIVIHSFNISVYLFLISVETLSKDRKDIKVTEKVSEKVS